MEQVKSGEANWWPTRSTVETPRTPKFPSKPQFATNEEEVIVEESDSHFEIPNIIFGY